MCLGTASVIGVSEPHSFLLFSQLESKTSKFCMIDSNFLRLSSRKFYYPNIATIDDRVLILMICLSVCLCLSLSLSLFPLLLLSCLNFSLPHVTEQSQRWAIPASE